MVSNTNTIIIVSIFVVLVLIIICVACLVKFNYIITGNSLYGTAKELPTFKDPGNAKIAIFMVATPEISNYSEITIDQNKRWAKMHGYDFFHYSTKKLKSLPINFSKIQYSLDLLKTGKYDYVMYIDADAIVHKMDYDVRNIIKKYLRGPKSILFGEDCFSDKDCSKPGRINSGVFIVKNNIFGKKILECWKDSTYGPCNHLVNVFPNCQLIFTNCVFPKWFWAIQIIPFNIMNGARDTLFIKHAMAMDNVQRISELKQVYQPSGDDRIKVF